MLEFKCDINLMVLWSLLLCLSLVSVAYAGLPLILIYLLSLFAVSYTIYLLKPGKYKKMMFIDHNHCVCYKANGAATMMRLDKETIFTRFFVILCLREVDGHKRFAWVSTRLDAQWSAVLKMSKSARSLV